MIFQLDSATNKLVDFGIIGVVLIFVGFMAYKMWIKINSDQEIWRTEAIESRKELINLSLKQNELNTKLIDIRERDVDLNKDNFHAIKQRLDEIPEKVRKELQVDLLSNCKLESKNK